VTNFSNDRSLPYLPSNLKKNNLSQLSLRTDDIIGAFPKRFRVAKKQIES